MTPLTAFLSGIAIGLFAGVPWVLHKAAQLNESAAKLLQRSAELDRESRELTREALAFRQSVGRG